MTAGTAHLFLKHGSFLDFWIHFCLFFFLLQSYCLSIEKSEKSDVDEVDATSSKDHLWVSSNSLSDFLKHILTDNALKMAKEEAV